MQYLVCSMQQAVSETAIDAGFDLINWIGVNGKLTAFLQHFSCLSMTSGTFTTKVSI